MSLLFVDSGSDLGFDQIKMLGIECVNLPYSINDRGLLLPKNLTLKNSIPSVERV